MHGRLPATEAAATESLYEACGKDWIVTWYLSLPLLNLSTHVWITANSLGLPAEWVHRSSPVLPLLTAAVGLGASVAAGAAVAAGAEVGAAAGVAAGAQAASNMLAKAMVANSRCSFMVSLLINADREMALLSGGWVGIELFAVRAS